MRKFSDEEKRKIVEDLMINKKPISVVVHEYGICAESAHFLLNRARKHGIESVLHCNTRRRYSAEFRKEVVMHVINGNTLRSTAITFNLTLAIVQSWYKRYSERGIEGLSNTRRQKMLKDDRPDADSPKNKKRVHTEKEYQELEKRLRHAEMENEFLKKLNALVQERIERERRK